MSSGGVARHHAIIVIVLCVCLDCGKLSVPAGVWRLCCRWEISQVQHHRLPGVLNPPTVAAVNEWRWLHIWKCLPRCETAHTTGGVTIFVLSLANYKRYVSTVFSFSGAIFRFWNQTLRTDDTCKMFTSRVGCCSGGSGNWNATSSDSDF